MRNGNEKRKAKDPGVKPGRGVPSQDQIGLIVFVAVNGAAGTVLATVELALFRLGEVAVVLGQIPLFLTLNASLAPFEM